MITLVHHHAERPSFYRVDVGYNLFGEYSVVREWGDKGQKRTHWITSFDKVVGSALTGSFYDLLDFQISILLKLNRCTFAIGGLNRFC